ncbi:MAG: SH3 domain-containing protein [Lachnospiraceae bacterium]|nr:SH3 domain-containing protein [Candidatus Colinaster equi]
MKKKWEKFREGLIDWIKDVAELIRENKRITIIVLSFIVLIVVAILISSFAAKKSRSVENVISTEDSMETDEYPITNEPLEMDAYPEVNELMKKYYQAVADGDVETVKALKTAVDDKEEIVINKKSEFIENYPVITCYTKKGPVDGSYLVYAYYEVKLNDYEATAPGLNAWYVCKKEDGSLYINDDEQDEKLSNYCKIVSVQDDVVDLNNTVNVKFNEVMEANEELATFLEELPDTLMASVGEELAKAEAPETETTVETVEETTQEEVAVEKMVKATTVVNVRASDSETADKLGKAMEGEEYKLLEEKLNGWSKIEFEGKEAYIKTEFLEVVSEKEVEATDNEEPEAGDDDNNDDDAAKAAEDSPTTGKATVTDTVKLRKSASTSADQLDLIYTGAQVEIIMKQADGWTKVKYDGKTGFVKSEFLE